MLRDRTLKKLVKSIDTATVPPKGLKQKILGRVMSMEINVEPVLTPFERFIFERPLRTACVISVPVSGFLWAVMGSGFLKLFSSFIG